MSSALKYWKLRSSSHDTTSNYTRIMKTQPNMVIVSTLRRPFAHSLFSCPLNSPLSKILAKSVSWSTFGSLFEYWTSSCQVVAILKLFLKDQPQVSIRIRTRRSLWSCIKQDPLPEEIIPAWTYLQLDQQLQNNSPCFLNSLWPSLLLWACLGSSLPTNARGCTQSRVAVCRKSRQ